MKKKIRSLLLYLIVFLFVITAPPVLFYAWGYSFNWPDQEFLLGGAFYLKSIPKKATIYIDGQTKGKTPALIKGLKSKSHQVRISQEGFYPWQKNLRIEPGLVTEARNIFLVPKKIKVELVKTKLADNFSLKQWLSQKENQLLSEPYYLEESNRILYQTNALTQEKQQVSLKPLPAYQNYQILALDNQIAVLATNQEKLADLYLFEPKNKSFKLIAQKVKSAQFASDGKKILYFTPNEIWVYYLEDILIQPHKLAGQQELISRFSQSIKGAFWYTPTNEHIIFALDSMIKITELDGRDYRNTFNLLEAAVDQIAYSPDQKKIYFVENNQLLGFALKPGL